MCLKVVDTFRFVKDIAFTGCTGGCGVEDLSANYSVVLPPPTTTPEPSSLASLALGLISLAVGAMWRRKNLGAGVEA